MYKIFHKRNRALVLVILVLILGTAAYGFANSLTWPATDVYAGEGSTTVSGYTVSAIDFALNPADPTEIVNLTFNLDGPADTVYVSLTQAQTTWFECTVADDGSGGTDVSCPNVSGTTVLSIDGLSISAVD
jgi:hypothetical protein